MTSKVRQAARLAKFKLTGRHQDTGEKLSAIWKNGKLEVRRDVQAELDGLIEYLDGESLGGGGIG